MSETIAGDKCPNTSDGYNPDTGKYDMGASNMAQLRADISGYSDPYDPSSINRFDATMEIPQQQENVPQESWLSNHQGHLEQFIIDNECDKIKEFYIAIESHVDKSNEQESQIKMYNQGIKEYKEAYQKFCE